jgi:hypothetical protein
MPTPFAYHRLVVGYHGCDRAIGEEVLVRGQPLKRSINPWDWLGEGIYFWEHGPERALEFARWKKRRGEITEPFVLGAYIHLGQCFDLTDTVATRQLGAFYTALTERLAAAGLPLPSNEKGGPADFDLVKRFLDCAVLNFGLDRLSHTDPPVRYDTVRGVFPEGGEAYPGSKILMKTHVQVAVRNPDCILGYFRPTGYDL